MKISRYAKALSRPVTRGVAMSAVLVALAACNMNQEANPYEGIGFREARFAEISAMREYRACRDEGLELDKQARASGNSGSYRASAELLDKCETKLGPEAAGVATDERMRAYALSVQNFLKAGEIERAGQNLQKFKEAFPGKDIYYQDGSSYIETMEILLGQRDPSALAPFASLNVNSTLKGELRRIRYWKQN